MKVGERFRRKDPMETIEIIGEREPLTMSGMIVYRDDEPIYLRQTRCINGLNEGYERLLAEGYIEKEFEPV